MEYASIRLVSFFIHWTEAELFQMLNFEEKNKTKKEKKTKKTEYIYRGRIFAKKRKSNGQRECVEMQRHAENETSPSSLSLSASIESIYVSASPMNNRTFAEYIRFFFFFLFLY